MKTMQRLSLFALLLWITPQLGFAATVEDILKTAIYENITSSKTTIYRKSGGFAQAKIDFTSLTRTVANVKGITVGKLPDGTSVNVRDFSKSDDNVPTLEIQYKKVIKIRYP